MNKILNKIKDYSTSIGFQEVSVTDLDEFSDYTEKLREFIKKKYYGEMLWMKDKAVIRENPKHLWHNAKSAIVLGLNYGPDVNPLKELKDKERGYISIYARRRDYHKVIKKKLKSICRYIGVISNIKVKVFVDTAPLMEKPLAEKSSIGWIGKHTNLVSKNYGSWLFLGIILTDYDFKKREIKYQNRCGTCKACNDICPTKAFTAPYKLDARKCISYLTIEHKSHIDHKYREPIGNRIFGCDDCLAICPWNKFAKDFSDDNLKIENNLVLPSLKDLINLNEAEYRSRFAGTSLRRLGYFRFLRNILIAIGNSKDYSLIESIIVKIDHESPLVRAMAVWALYKLNKSSFKKEKLKRFNLEKDPYVKNEWNLGSY